MQETWVQSLGREDPLEKGMAIHSSILVWRIPWIEEPGGLQSMGCEESDTTERLTHTHTHTQSLLQEDVLHKNEALALTSSDTNFKKHESFKSFSKVLPPPKAEDKSTAN